MATTVYHELASVNLIRGHHIYKHLWTPFVSEQLDVEKEHGNKYCSMLLQTPARPLLAQSSPARPQTHLNKISSTYYYTVIIIITFAVISTSSFV